MNLSDFKEFARERWTSDFDLSFPFLMMVAVIVGLVCGTVCIVIPLHLLGAPKLFEKLSIIPGFAGALMAGRLMYWLRTLVNRR